MTAGGATGFAPPLDIRADRVMIGSDYCFDMGYIRPREIVEKRLRLSRADQRRIVGATAARLLALG